MIAPPIVRNVRSVPITGPGKVSLEPVEVAVDAVEELQMFARQELHCVHAVLAAQLRKEAERLLRLLAKVTDLTVGDTAVVDRKSYSPTVKRWVSVPRGRTLVLHKDGTATWRGSPVGEYTDLGPLSLAEVEAFLGRQPGKFYATYT